MEAMASESHDSQDVGSATGLTRQQHNLSYVRAPGLYFSPDEPSGGDVPADASVDDSAQRIQQLEAQLTRANEQLSGARQFMTAAQERGFKSRADFDGFDPAAYQRFRDIAARTQGKVDLDALANLVTSSADNGRADAGTEFDPDSFRQEILKEVQGATARSRAEDEHAKRELAIGGKIDAFLTELGVSEARLRFERAGLLGNIQGIASVYDEGHPLHETHLQHPADDAIAKLFDEYKAAHAEERGRQIEAKADAAKKGGTTTPAGSRTSEVPTDTDEPKGKPRPGTPEHREIVKAELEKRRKAREAGAVSTLA